MVLEYACAEKNLGKITKKRGSFSPMG